MMTVIPFLNMLSLSKKKAPFELVDWMWCIHIYTVDLSVYTEPTCMSLDSVTLLISMGLGLKAPVPSKDSCRTQHAHNLVCVVLTLAAGCVNASACFLSVLGWPVISSWTCCGDWQGHPLWSGQCSSPMRALSSETLWPASSTPPYPVKWKLS